MVELAQQILAIHGMVDIERGITLNAAPVWGGTRPNVIPPEAGCEIDLRVNSIEDGARMEAAVLGLTARTPGCRVTVEGGMNRPPFAETACISALYDKARAIAAEVGIDIAEAAPRRRIGRQLHRGDGDCRRWTDWAAPAPARMCGTSTSCGANSRRAPR